ncbi:DUF4124 domain-containing protein [Inhella gelatinilytica]|uniref:DUF4124 domain-containing protein n=1 Tax=Inhella gelatinilytica TaxID=2795030 RepID=A0A931IW43_9BURK|nr:DUF4124 domain-containing protein [Inhella gelatinilytica]MBH9552656.1 DUF4124 domain-containing protein [Inhella gelatinilytica]
MAQPSLLRTVCLVALCSWAAVSAHAQQGQWKWRDANGNVQYSDRPPPASIPEKDILARPFGARTAVKLQTYGEKASSPQGGASAPPTKKAESKPNMSPQTEARLKEEERQNAAVRAENCSRARQQLTLLESGARISQTNDKGERTILDDPARAAEIQKMKAVIAAECQ